VFVAASSSVHGCPSSVASSLPIWPYPTLAQSHSGAVTATLTGGDFSVWPTARERSHIARAASQRASAKATKMIARADRLGDVLAMLLDYLLQQLGLRARRRWGAGFMAGWHPHVKYNPYVISGTIPLTRTAQASNSMPNLRRKGLGGGARRYTRHQLDTCRD
jgi:hypothetical protein